jgi:hypothetical protein
MQLDKKSKKVLSLINIYRNKYGIIENSEELLLYLPKKYTLNIVDDVLGHLYREEYIVCAFGADSVSDISLTYKGENYREFQWIDLKEFLLKSILVPIAVSAVVSLITIYFTHLFKVSK